MKLTRELLRNDAWRSLGINERRVVDFLMIEHMSKASTTASSRRRTASLSNSALAAGM